MIAKQIMFWLWAILAIFGIIGEITLLQFLPIAGILVILAAEIWANKKLFVPAMVLSISMAFLNLLALSWIDVVFWTATIAIFVKK